MSENSMDSQPLGKDPIAKDWKKDPVIQRTGDKEDSPITPNGWKGEDPLHPWDGADPIRAFRQGGTHPSDTESPLEDPQQDGTIQEIQRDVGGDIQAL